ncbi:paeninodin family lasso peptide [Paenibacillus sp. KS-LC4]|uniref:paeninodin family lasso peptide n=1 Tax=Paenibacillus sp. KS-LC4 TaxID=2979727 RepID=UPI0030D5C894
MEKQQWQAPVLETLQVSETMAGVGTRYIDFVKPGDFDITDDPTPFPVDPGVIFS